MTNFQFYVEAFSRIGKAAKPKGLKDALIGILILSMIAWTASMGVLGVILAVEAIFMR